MTASLLSTLELSQILDIIIESAKRLLKAEASSLLLIDDLTRELYFASASGEAAELLKNLTVPLGKGIAGWCAREGKAKIVNDVSRSREFYPVIDEKTGFKTTSILCVPLVLQEKTIGVIEVLNKKENRPWTQTDKRLLYILGAQAARVIENARQHRAIKEHRRLLHDEINARHKIIGKSTPMQKIMRLIEKVASTNTTVLIQGENGCGKELIARYIHRLGNRRDKPFIAVNCAAIPTTLLESELFGHEKGAFTGAISSYKGRFEMTHEGTIFLDEIGDLMLETQMKLMRVLQEREFQRLGGQKTIKIDVRIIAATNQDLVKKMKEQKFRDDLYYRLNVFPLYIPPLRERKEDIPLLCEHFLSFYARDINKQVKYISQEAMELLVNYNWPGNVRELQNLIERAVVLANTDTISPRELNIPGYKRFFEIPIEPGLSLKEASDRFRYNYITATLNASGGNQKAASNKLRIQATYLSKLLKRMRTNRQDSK